MEKLGNHNRTMDEIVFEGRNKLYGAFELRLHYNQRMARAMLISILFFVSLFSTPKIIELIAGRQVEDMFVIDDGGIIYLPPVPEIEPPRIKPAASAPVETPEADMVRNTTPEVVTDDSPEPEVLPPTQDEMEGKTIGQENLEGTGGESIDTPIDNGSSSGTSTEPSSEPAVEAPVFFAEQMPEFPGGTEALYKFISENVRYSGVARENRISGKIIVQFVVSKDGEISGAKIISGLGGGLNAQVLEAVNKMPRWKPGKHNGRAVPVTFTLPVKFELKD